MKEYIKKHNEIGPPDQDECYRGGESVLIKKLDKLIVVEIEFLVEFVPILHFLFGLISIIFKYRN